MHRLWLGICALSLMLSGAGLTLAAETSESKDASSATTGGWSQQHGAGHTPAKTPSKKGRSRHRKAHQETTGKGKGTTRSNGTTTLPAGETH